MSSIGNNSILIGQHKFQINTRAVNNSLLKLSTGLKINRGADDPAGLITSENLRATLAALEAETRSLERVDHVATVADGALSEMSSMLIEAEGLIVANANTGALSQEEIEANQMEIDSILSTVNRLTSSTSFNGKQLFDGNLTLSASGTDLDIDQITNSQLGQVTVDGTDYAISDIASGGSLDTTQSSTGVTIAQMSIREAISNINVTRGEIGSFQKNTVQTRLNSVEVAIENISAAESDIRDMDDATEIAILARLELMQSSSLLALKSSMGSSNLVLRLLK